MDRLILSAMENGTEKSALLRAQLAARSSMPIPPAEVTAASPSAMKVGLFRKLFSGRTDVFPIPGGHFKFPHPWPGQNPPLDNGGSGECLRGVSALGNTSGGFLQSPALAVELQQMAVMHQPVQ